MISPGHYLRPLLAPESVALIGASAKAGSLGRIVYENLLAGGFQRRAFCGQPESRHDSGPAGISVADRDRQAGRPGGYLRAAGRGAGDPRRNAPAGARRRHSFRGADGEVRRLSPLAPRNRRARPRLARSSRRARELRRHPHLARAQCQLQRGRGGAGPVDPDLAIGRGLRRAARFRTHRGHGIRVGRRTRRDRRRRFRRSARVRAGRRRDRRHRALYRNAARCAEFLVGLARGCAHQAGDRAQGGAASGRHTAPATSTRTACSKPRSSAPAPFACIPTRSCSPRRAILASGRIPRGNRLAIVTNGRGPGLLAIDRAAETGVVLADLSAATRVALAALLPPEADPGNPVDVRGEATPARFGAAVTAVLADPGVDAVLALHVPVPAAPPVATADAVATAARTCGQAGARRVARRHRSAGSARRAGIGRASRIFSRRRSRSTRLRRSQPIGAIRNGCWKCRRRCPR